MRYSIEPRIFVKGYGFLSFARSMGKNIGKIIIKNLSSKYNQKRFYSAKNVVLMHCFKKANLKNSRSHR